MPEGPETAIYSRQVAHLLGAAHISVNPYPEVKSEWPHWWDYGMVSLDKIETIGDHHIVSEDLSSLHGQRIYALDHVGKMTTFRFGEHFSPTVYVAYGMTGSWSLNPTRHSRVAFHFQHGGTLFFNDVRKFGRIGMRDFQQRVERVGTSMFHPTYDTAMLPALQKRYHNRGLRWFLLDPWIVPGVGNYIANEALWWAKLHPTLRIGNMSPSDLQRAIEMCRQVYISSVLNGGVSIFDFRHLDGSKGAYQSSLKCYRSHVCERCQSTIERMPDGESGHYFCPTCQPVPLTTGC